MKRFFPLTAILLLLACIAASAGAQDSPKSSLEARQVYSDAANFQNNKVYDLAVGEWQRFIKEFPQDPLVAKAQHYLGVCYLQLKQPNHRRAMQAFQEVIDRYPRSELIEQAYLSLGSCQYSLAQQGDEELAAKAAETFSLMRKRFPQGALSDQASYFLGESLYLQKKKEDAVVAYQHLLAQHEKSPLRCSALYALGVVQEELGRHAEAGKVYDRYLKGCGADGLAGEVRMRKAETVLQLGQFAQAAMMFRDVAAEKGFSAADHALTRQAFCALKLKKLVEAGDLFAKVATDFPQSSYLADSTMDAGRCYYRAEKFEQAGRWFRKVLSGKGQQRAEAAHWLCRIEIQSRQFEQAEKLAKAAFTQSGDSPYRVHLLVDRAEAVLEQPGREAEALEIFLQVAGRHAQHPQAAQALYNAAFTALQLQKYQQALDCTEQFLKKYPKQSLVADVQYVAAESHLQSGQHGRAQRVYHALVTKYPRHVDADQWRMRLVMTLFLQKKYDKTIERITGSLLDLETPKDRAEIFFLLGTSQLHLGHWEESLKSLSMSLSADDHWRQADETLLNLSRVQQKLGKPAQATESIKRLVSEFPESRLLDHAYYRLAQYRAELHDEKTAIEVYQRLLANWPKSPLAAHARYAMGWVQLREGDYLAAEKSFSKLISLHAGHALVSDAQNARAVCRQRKGDFVGGIQDVEMYLKSNPQADERRDSLYVRGLCEVGLQRFPQAVKTFQSILATSEAYPRADKVLYELAWSYKEMNSEDQSISVFRRLVTSHPESSLAAESRYHLGEDFYQKGEFSLAIEQYSQCKTRAGAADLGEKAIYKIAWSNYKLKDYRQALSSFNEQVKTYDRGELLPDGMFMRAESLLKLEKHQDALAAYRQAMEVKGLSQDRHVLALLHSGQCAGQLGKWEDSLQLLRTISADYPQSSYLSEAIYEQGWALQSLGQLEPALKLYQLVVSKSRSRVGAQARFMIGEIYFSKKNFSEAIQHFQRVKFGFGGENASEEIKIWQARAGYEAARCTEVQIQTTKNAGRRKELISAARDHYRYVLEKHAKSEFASEARKRLAGLGRFAR